MNQESKAWTCKECGCKHLQTLYVTKDDYDSCPACADLTEHEWRDVESFAVVVVEPNGEQWVYSKHTDLAGAEGDRSVVAAKMPGAKIKVCDWT